VAGVQELQNGKILSAYYLLRRTAQVKEEKARNANWRL
jgi:hypothetical protein